MDASISTSSKKSFLLNLIYKSLKRDSAVVRKVAIARRLLQVSNLDEPFLACASLYTISEANKNSNTETDEKSSDKNTDNKLPEEPMNNSTSKSGNASKSDSYSVEMRNPLYSNADRQDLWEFSLLSKNFHPSVNEFVSSLLVDGEVSYSGDPFNDFTRIKFLDKFVFRNPKKGVQAANKKFYTRSQVNSNQPQVYSSEFRDQKESKVNADERFFFEYFKAQKTSKDTDLGAELDEDDDTAETDALDFADDIKVSSTLTQEEKKRKVKEAENDEDESMSESGSEYSYGDIDDEDDGTEQLNDKAYEKFLWENLNSDGESIQGSDDDQEEADDGGNVLEEAAEDDWEDLDVAESEEEMEDKDENEEIDSMFMDAENLDSLILKNRNKKKRKNISVSEKDGKVSKKVKSKKSKKNKFKKDKSV